MPNYFDNFHYATKRIAPNDIRKGAFFVTNEQQEILEMAAIFAETEENTDQTLPANKRYTARIGRWVNNNEIAQFTYYASNRNVERPSEPRIGRITSRLTEGDYLTLIWDGYNISFYTSSDNNAFPPDRLEKLPSDYIPQKTPGYAQWKRDTRVMIQAKERANYQCEYPNCSWIPFLDSSNKNYIETHHIIPLAMGGPDILENCIALCPGCHRQAHYSSPEEQEKMRKIFKRIRGLSHS